MRKEQAELKARMAEIEAKLGAATGAASASAIELEPLLRQEPVRPQTVLSPVRVSRQAGVPTGEEGGEGEDDGEGEGEEGEDSDDEDEGKNDD